jgi:hypothetical protein
MQPATTGEPWAPRARQCGLFALVAGRCVAGSEGVDIPAESLAWFDAAPAALVFQPHAASPPDPPGWWLAAEPREADA